ncbi:FERM C and FERM M domain containing protein [Trichuris trichiura]|uniref:FERM C and FERM M domain containing protein n=1 Tax=Trichuris trichiura TaxID=36087 RepID=A0A077Z9L1_TRITR|nr:FERM C and FERM M domain containing protein [Trichuris trichiura]
MCLLLRIKFFPEDISVIKEEYTRYLFVQQLRRDIRHGRLYCPPNEAALLGAYLVQGVLGDYNPSEHIGNYVSQYKLFVNQIPRLEEKIASIHKTLTGMSPAEADTKFLEVAVTLDTYGFYPFTVTQLFLGAAARGVVAYKAQTKTLDLHWNDIKKLDYLGKDFLIYLADGFELPMAHGLLNEGSLSKRKKVFRFTCVSATYCKQLWKYILAQKAFFTCEKGTDVHNQVSKRQLFLRKSTFRFSGRVFQELKDSRFTVPIRDPPTFHRCHMLSASPRDSFHFKDSILSDVEMDETAELAALADEKPVVLANSHDMVAQPCKANQQHDAVNAVAAPLPTSAVGQVDQKGTKLLDVGLEGSTDVPRLRGLYPRDCSTPIAAANGSRPEMAASSSPNEDAIDGKASMKTRLIASTSLTPSRADSGIYSTTASEQASTVSSSTAIQGVASGRSPPKGTKTILYIIFLVSFLVLFFSIYVKRHYELDYGPLMVSLRSTAAPCIRVLGYYQNAFFDWFNSLRSWYMN